VPAAAKIVSVKRRAGGITTGDMTDEEVYRKHAPELLRFASGLVGPLDAQDVVSNAFLHSIQSPTWPRVRDRRPYLFRAVLNEVRMRHRSTMRRRAREQLAAGPESVEPPQVDVDVLAAVGALSTRQRAVVFLTYWHDLAPNEIADLLDISPGSVRRHLARGRERLKDRLR